MPSPFDTETDPRQSTKPLAAPSPFGGASSNAPSGFSQDRLTGLTGDLQSRASQYGNGAFVDHWNSLTGGIDKNNNDAVEKFAQEHGGVSRGQVGMNGQYHTMTNDELLAAAKSKYQPTFQRTLTNDPTYNSILSGTHPSVAGIAGQRLGLSPFQVGENAAGVQGAQNNAAAINTYAGAAADAGKGALATGQGNLAAGQGRLAEGQAAQTDATGKANTLYPSMAAQNNANATQTTAVTPFLTGKMAADTALTTANAGHVTAMTPFDTAREDAETKAIPAQVEAGKQQQQIHNQQVQSQTDLNEAKAGAAGRGKGAPAATTGYDFWNNPSDTSKGIATNRATGMKLPFTRGQDGQWKNDMTGEALGEDGPNWLSTQKPAAPQQAAAPAQAAPAAAAPASQAQTWVANTDGTFSHPGYPGGKYKRVQGGYQKVK